VALQHIGGVGVCFAILAEHGRHQLLQPDTEVAAGLADHRPQFLALSDGGWIGGDQTVAEGRKFLLQAVAVALGGNAAQGALEETVGAQKPCAVKGHRQVQCLRRGGSGGLAAKACEVLGV
jgi:hypothetical protein